MKWIYYFEVFRIVQFVYFCIVTPCFCTRILLVNLEYQMPKQTAVQSYQRADFGAVGRGDWRTGETFCAMDWGTGKMYAVDWRTGKTLCAMDWWTGKTLCAVDGRTGKTLYAVDWRTGETLCAVDWRTGKTLCTVDHHMELRFLMKTHDKFWTLHLG